MSRERLRIAVRGAVQGVGFRPLVHRLARELRLGGFVRNDGADLLIEAEGDAVHELLARLRAAPPDGARIDSVSTDALPVRGETTLVIAPSRSTASPRAIVPDRVTCTDCLHDVLDERSRWFGYPFTNCTRCGPRWSIVDRVPYDRANTAMAGFPMCAACRAEYEDPSSRRFHAQPIACPACGPRLLLRARDGAPIASAAGALDAAARLLRDGAIVALKGLGGYQLLVDASDAAAVERLRERKSRPHKPLAVMVSDLAAAQKLARIDDAEAALLASAAGPIVLLRSRPRALPAVVHPHHDETGILLPTTPLHHLLLARVDRALVCTSGNRGDEPICTDDDDARARLAGIADAFLVHDRPIRRPVDDSVARVVDGAAQVLRLGRGYAPLCLPLARAPIAIATGPHLKGSAAVADGTRVVAGPHVGDLENTLALDALRASSATLEELFAVAPQHSACDLHPDYASTALAHERGLPSTGVQHHVAHALAALVEHDRAGPVLAVVWDGTGLGTDGTIWGGEFLRVERSATGVRWQRMASLRPFRLPGGDAAARDPARALAGLLFELPDLHAEIPRTTLRQLAAGMNAPWCSSAGRLFDGVAALLGHTTPQSYEGMAACLLERDAARADAVVAAAAAATAAAEIAAPGIAPGDPLRLDWEPTLRALLERVRAGACPRESSRAFHLALVAAIVSVAHAVGEPTVVLTGGCFQSRVLTEQACRALRAARFEVLLARRLPPNDGGIAAGQLAAIDTGETHVPRDTRPH